MSFRPQARILPPEEWEALAGPLKAFDPAFSFIVVVEDGGPGGTLLGRWGATTVVHVEGLEIIPEAQKHAGVGGALLSEMVRGLLAQNILEVLTQAETPEVEAMIESAGGKRVPGNTWVIPLKGDR